jgi:hypothetical protein
VRWEIVVGLVLCLSGVLYLADVGGIARRQGEWRERTFGSWHVGEKRGVGWYVKVERYLFGGGCLAMGLFYLSFAITR